MLCRTICFSCIASVCATRMARYLHCGNQEKRLRERECVTLLECVSAREHSTECKRTNPTTLHLSHVSLAPSIDNRNRLLDYLVQIWDSDHTPGGLEFPKGPTTARATVKVSKLLNFRFFCFFLGVKIHDTCNRTKEKKRPVCVTFVQCVQHAPGWCTYLFGKS